MEYNRKEALEDYNRIRNSLGFRIFLDSLQTQLEEQDRLVMNNATSLNDLIPQQQAIGAKRVLKYILDHRQDLVEQQAT